MKQSSPPPSPPASVASTAGLREGFAAIREILENTRLADRSAASDEDRLAWIDDIRDIGRRVTALDAVLIAEADEAGSALRARHTRLEDWMARSGQCGPGQGDR
jgi:hypothetical protein